MSFIAGGDGWDVAWCVVKLGWVRAVWAHLKQGQRPWARRMTSILDTVTNCGESGDYRILDEWITFILHPSFCLLALFGGNPPLRETWHDADMCCKVFVGDKVLLCEWIVDGVRRRCGSVASKFYLKIKKKIPRFLRFFKIDARYEKLVLDCNTIQYQRESTIQYSFYFSLTIQYNWVKYNTLKKSVGFLLKQNKPKCFSSIFVSFFIPFFQLSFMSNQKYFEECNKG